ncbi:MAG: hypothetical protein ACFFD9_00960 [Candidatus Thorarchaeota archaeon]
MGLMKTAAVKGIIPAGFKARELQNNLLRLIAEIPMVMEERFGDEGLEAIAETFRRLGKRDAAIMKERLGLGDTLKDAMDAWIIIGHIMGAKMEVTRESDHRVVADHPFCPQYEESKKHGKIYCESACWPYVGTIAAEIAPGIRMDMVRPADMDRACTKALVFTTSEVE